MFCALSDAWSPWKEESLAASQPNLIQTIPHHVYENVKFSHLASLNGVKMN
jgi:hypothetical protein